MPAAANYQKAT